MKTIFHVSDLHYLAGSYATHRVVLAALFDDIRQRFGKVAGEKYFAISGDLVKEGKDRVAFDELRELLLRELAKVGIKREKTICVPGNHDLSRSIVEADLIEHEGVISQCFSEDIFTKYVRGKHLFKNKFSNYMEFEKNFAGYGIGDDALGQGHNLGGGVGVYCLNTAYFSAGGLSGAKGAISDKGRLVVDTTGLHKWIQEENFSTRVLVMHHPLDWLTEWSAQELRALLGRKVGVLITGHVHDQEFYSRANGAGAYSHLKSPAIFTSKDAQLGYAALMLDDGGMPQRVEYRQWVPKSQKFVAGTSFSSTDDGGISLNNSSGADAEAMFSLAEDSASVPKSPDRKIHVASILEARLDEALKYFFGQPAIFVEPIFSDSSEAISSRGDKPKETFGVLEILDKGFPAAIHAPPQFGLTCAARHFCLQAWISTGKLWIYIDALDTKPNKKSVVDAIQDELVSLGVEMAVVQGIVIDSVRSSDKDSIKLVHKVAELYAGLDVLFMRSNDVPGGGDLTEVAGVAVKHSFLWSMPRSSIRKMVNGYNDVRPIGDEDIVTARLALDLEMMNIHRTPINCFTLLRVSEVQYEDSPVNRAELIKRVLCLLFNGDDVPTYKGRPDVKDCEFVIGYFCEVILRSGDSRFTREKFLASLRGFCDKNYLDIDVAWVFDVLCRNNIVVQRGHGFEFKFIYWIMYFAAQRMCQSQEFRDYVFQGGWYSAYPEIIEFYTGSNRSMSDAVDHLSKDLAAATKEFDVKIALPDGFDIFSLAQWAPSSGALEQMREDTSRGVERSNLPSSVKDQYADRAYDTSKPYAQDVRAVLQGFSYNKMLQGMRAASKALRNSDYVDTEAKKRLLAEILAVWERVATVILVLVPALAERGEAVFDDVRYVLDGDFPEELEERFQAVLQEIPRNISSYYEDDLFSHKMGPLLASQLTAPLSNVAKHLVALVLIRNRPRRWSEAIRQYIVSLPMNSFYLLDIYQCLRGQYRYGYVSEAGLEELEQLIRVCAAKHLTGAKDLGSKKVDSIFAKIESKDVIPDRAVGLEGE